MRVLPTGEQVGLHVVNRVKDSAGYTYERKTGGSVIDLMVLYQPRQRYTSGQRHRAVLYWGPRVVCGGDPGLQREEVTKAKKG